MGINSIVADIGRHLSDFNRSQHFVSQHYTQAPTSAYRGINPTRQPKLRGGIWNQKTLNQAENSTGALFASCGAFLAVHTIAVAAEPGTSYPWEGSASTETGSVNTGNGTS